MKKRNSSIAIILIFSVLLPLNSCKVPLTSTLKANIENKDLKLGKVQFYLSKKFELWRKTTQNEAQIKRGKVKFKDGAYYEIIVFKEGLPGIAEYYGKTLVEVRFEQGKDKKLTFSYDYNKDHYMLKYNQNSYGEGNGSLKYGDYTFRVIHSGDYKSRPFLKVKKNQSKEVNRDVRKAKGMKVR